MSRPRVITAAVLVYAVLASALVSHLGSSHRDSLRLSLATREAGTDKPPVTAETPPAVPTPESTPESLKNPEIASTDIPNRQPKLEARPKPDLPPVAPNPTATPTPTTPDPPPAPPPPPEPHWADDLDLTRLTAQQETRIGAELHARLSAIIPVDDQGDLQRVRRAAAKMLDARERQEIDYKFFVLVSDEVFCASLPGGYVYLSQGFFRFAGKDLAPEDDYMMEFALGHEIAHVDQRHDLRIVEAGRGSTKEKGQKFDLLSALLIPLLFAYPDKDEFEADAWAYQQLLKRPDRTRRQARMFLYRLDGFAEEAGFRNGRKPLDRLILVENHYRAHPAADVRLEKIKTISRPLGAASP